MPKIFDIQTDRNTLRVDEQVWFDTVQPLLIWMANTDYGRDLLNIDKSFPLITQMGKNFVRSQYSPGKFITDFRVGAKWANVIRCRFAEFWNYAQYYPLRQHSVIPAISRTMGTTTTLYPDPDPETTTVDGYAWNIVVAGQSWANTRGGNGVNADDSSTEVDFVFLRSDETGGAAPWEGIERSFFGFDTSSIPDTDTVDDATFSVYAINKQDNMSQSISIVAGTLASSTEVVAADFQGTVANTTRFASDKTIASINLTAYNDFALNSSGLSHIDKTGVTTFGGKLADDVDNSEPTHPGAKQVGDVGVSASEEAGTSQDPKLVVNHTVGSTFVPKAILIM